MHNRDTCVGMGKGSRASRGHSAVELRNEGKGCTFVPTKVPKALDKNYWRELHCIDSIIPKVHVRLLPHSRPSLCGIIAPVGDVDSIAFFLRQ